MMKSGFKALLLGAVVYAFVGVGCNENTVDPDLPGDSTATPLAPTALMANSTNGGVNLKWNASTSTNVSSYELTVAPAPTSGSSVISIASGLNTFSVGNLTNGTTYSFSLKAKSTTKSSAPATISWAPAVRYTGVKIYETSSSNGSGVNLATGTVLNVAAGSTWDLGLDTRIIGGVVDNIIGAPSQLSYDFSNTASARATLLSDKLYENVGSLDVVFDTEALGSTTASMAPKVAAAVKINNTAQNVVFFVKTVEGNYAKILLKAVGGKVLQGTAPNRYAEMDISYQTTANVPYALVKSNNPPAFKTVENSSVKKVSAE